MANFRTPNGDTHLIDQAGNHFINKKCVNPKITEDFQIGKDKDLMSYIGVTYRNITKKVDLPEKTGSVPHRIDREGRFIRL